MKLVKQRYNWDCGVACIAMALGVTWEDARAMLPEGKGENTNGFFPSEVAAVFRAPMLFGRKYTGSLERCILQVSLRQGEMAHHFVWSENGLHDPQGVCQGWGMIASIDTVIPVDNTAAQGPR